MAISPHKIGRWLCAVLAVRGAVVSWGPLSGLGEAQARALPPY